MELFLLGITQPIALFHMTRLDSPNYQKHGSTRQEIFQLEPTSGTHIILKKIALFILNILSLCVSIHQNQSCSVTAVSYYFEQDISLNYVQSNKPCGTPVSGFGWNPIPCVSAGHTNHDWCPASAMEEIFKGIDYQMRQMKKVPEPRASFW